MDVEAGWWTTSGKIGLPTLARFMGVGRQQQQQDPSFSINYHELTIAGLIVKIYLEPVFRSFTELNKQYKIYCNQNQMPVRRLYKYRYYFKDTKYSFSQSKKDQCDICTAHVHENMQNNHTHAKEDAKAEKMKGDKSLVLCI